MLRSLLVLQKTIQSLNRKMWRWWPLSEILVPGASSHTMKEPWDGKQPRDHESEQSLVHWVGVLMSDVLLSDDPPVGLVLRALWEVLDSSQSGTHAACSLHAKASWTPWKRRLRLGNSSDHSSLCSRSTPANEQRNHNLLCYGGLQKWLSFCESKFTTLPWTGFCTSEASPEVCPNTCWR